MVTQRDALDRVSDSLVTSDTIGAGQIPAPADSGQQRSPLDTALQSFNQSMGFGSTDEIAARLRGEVETPTIRDRNFLQKYVLGGTRWGIIDLPGGVKFLNPLKTVFSGLSFVDDTVAQPLVGITVGGLANAFAGRTSQSKFGKIARQYRETLEQLDGSWWDKVRAVGEFNEQREGLFWGEKFLTATLADPTTYIGFGLAAKVPLVGLKFLAPLEAGYLSVVNAPFKVASRAYRGGTWLDLTKVPGLQKIPGIRAGEGLVPRTPRQRARSFGERVWTDVGEAIVASGGGRQVNQVTRREFSQMTARVLDSATAYQQLAPVERQLRDHLLYRPKFTARQANSLLDDITKGMDITFERAHLARPDIRGAISEAHERVLKSGVTSIEEEADFILRSTGIQVNKETLDRTTDYLRRYVARQYRNASTLVDKNTPQQVRQRLRARAEEGHLDESRQGFEEWAYRNGVFGAFVQRLNKAQVTLIQNGLNRHITRPMARLMLMFPLFPIQNAAEDFGRQLLGRSGVGFKSQAQLNRAIGGRRGVPVELELGREDLFDDIVSRAGEAGQDFGFLGDMASKMTRFGVDVDNPRVRSILNKMNPSTWIEMSNVWGRATRRMFMYDVSLKKMQGAIGRDFKNLEAVISDVPRELPKNLVNGIQDDVVFAVTRGDRRFVENIADDYTSDIIFKRSAQEKVDVYASANNWSEGVKESLRTWLDGTVSPAGNKAVTLKGLDDVVGSLEDTYWRDLAQTGELGIIAADVTTDALREAVGRISRREALSEPEAVHLIFQADEVAETLQRQIQDLFRSTTESSAFRSGESREQLFQEMRQRVEKMVSQGEEVIRQQSRAIRDLEVARFGQSEVAAEVQNKWDLFVSAWRKAREIDDEFFVNATKDDRARHSFWVARRERQSEHWEEVFARERELHQQRFNPAVNRLREIAGINNPPNVEKMRLGPRQRLSEAHVARALGVQRPQLNAAVLTGGFRSREDFIGHVMQRVSEHGHEGFGREAVGQIYDGLLRRVGMDSALNVKRQGFLRQVESLKRELQAEALAPMMGEKQGEALRRYLARVGDAVDAEDSGSLTRAGDDAIGATAEELNFAFVNYEGNALDDMMRSVFPFWTYQSQRIPFLLRTSMSNPAVYNTFVSPEARYYEQTDNGYIEPVSALPWLDVNLFGGMIFNAPRRVKQGSFSAEYEQGIAGGISAVQQQIEQIGLYWGPHISAFKEVVAGQSVAEALGEVNPPPIDLALTSLATTTKPIPGVTNAVNKMRLAVFPDRFRNYLISKVAWERGFSPADINFEDFTVNEGGRMTQDDLQGIISDAAAAEWVQTFAGMVRFRGPAEEKYREAKQEAVQAWTGLSDADLKLAERYNIPVTSLAPMPPKVRRAMAEIEGYEDFRAMTDTLRVGGAGDAASINSEFWQQIRTAREQDTLEQERDNISWFNGDIAPAAWRERVQERKSQAGARVEFLRGRRILPDGSIEVFNPDARYSQVPVTYAEYVEQQRRVGSDVLSIQHPLEALLDAYHSIRPIDEDGDGIPEWDRFFDSRENFERNVVPAEVRADFFEELDKNLTQPERVMKNMQRGILGVYWDIEREVAGQLGVATLVDDVRRAGFTDPALAERLRGTTAYRRYTRLVRERRERLRVTNPELDYALNVFGFTGSRLSFRSREARLWWEQDGHTPNLSRLS